MGVLSVFKHDLHNQFAKPILVLTFIAVACLPIHYLGFLIRENWDPYKKLQDLSIALVNLNQGLRGYVESGRSPTPIISRLHRADLALSQDSTQAQ
jgi:hypothetical protein